MTPPGPWRWVARPPTYTPPEAPGWTATGIVKCAAGDTTNNASITLNTSYDFTIPGISLGTKPITATGTMRCGG